MRRLAGLASIFLEVHLLVALLLRRLRHLRSAAKAWLVLQLFRILTRVVHGFEGALLPCESVLKRRLHLGHSVDRALSEVVHLGAREWLVGL